MCIRDSLGRIVWRGAHRLEMCAVASRLCTLRLDGIVRFHQCRRRECGRLAKRAGLAFAPRAVLLRVLGVAKRAAQFVAGITRAAGLADLLGAASHHELRDFGGRRPPRRARRARTPTKLPQSAKWVVPNLCLLYMYACLLLLHGNYMRRFFS